MATIAKIITVTVQHYADNGQTIASVYWRDTNHCYGVTTGDPANPHMAALIARAEREGARAC